MTDSELPKALLDNRDKSLSYWAHTKGLFHFVGLGIKLARLLRPGDVNTPIRTFERQAAARKNEIAVVFEERQYTWAQIQGRVNQWSRWGKSKNLQKGDIVVLNAENSVEFICFWLGMANLGVCTACINTNLTGDPLAHCVRIANGKLLISTPKQAMAYAALNDEDKPLSDDKVFVLEEAYAGTDAVKDIPFASIDSEVDSMDPSNLTPNEKAQISMGTPLMYIYTSGTTGYPKAGLIRNNRYCTGGYLLATAYGITENDVVYQVMPLYHSAAGIVGIGCMIYLGATISLRRKFSASKFLDDVRSTNATCFQYIGEICRYLLASPEKTDDGENPLRLAFGNGMRPDVWDRFKNRYNINQIGELYAATEGAGGLMNTMDEYGFSGAVGWVPPLLRSLYTVKIVKFDMENEEVIRDPKTGRCIPCGPEEPGQMVVEIRKIGGQSNYDGYVGNKNASEKKILHDCFAQGDQYFATGDILCFDKHGFYYFMDRVGDTFRWKGENVATTEVAHAFGHLPWVYECNVYGVPVPNHDGKAGMAAIAVKEGFELDLKDFYHTGEGLPVYARPAFMRVLKSMDTTGTFKHRKVDLQRDSFDPAKCGEGQVYFRSGKAKTYLPIDKSAMNDIQDGKVRL